MPVSLRQHTHQGLPTSDTQVPCVPVHTRVRTLKHLTPTVQGTLLTGQGLVKIPRYQDTVAAIA